MTRGWRPTPVVRTSIAWHGAALVLTVIDPALWPWALAVILGNHALLGGMMGWPTRSLVGWTVRGLPPGADGQVALTFDDGPDPDVTPRVLELLARHGAPATFFCIGARAARHPALLREIRQRGHVVGNHTMTHRRSFALGGTGAQRRDILAAQAVLGGHGQPPPSLFRAPFGIRSPLLDPVLHGLGLTHVAWTRRGLDTCSTDPARVLRRLTTGLRAGDILLLHDGNARRLPDGTPLVLPVLEALLPWLAANGLRPVALEDWRLAHEAPDRSRSDGQGFGIDARQGTTMHRPDAGRVGSARTTLREDPAPT